MNVSELLTSNPEARLMSSAGLSAARRGALSKSLHHRIDEFAVAAARCGLEWNG
ncbi:MAG: hypothetical protein LC772_08070 [Chloroflexi bacterium]|nr:hypothetical protein [Chloroflexota bacterium]